MRRRIVNIHERAIQAYIASEARYVSYHSSLATRLALASANCSLS